jgi:DNA-binding MarR family transcriptional regulator
MNVNTQYLTKTQAITEIMERTGVGRFVVERQINKMEGDRAISFIDDPRDFRRKLISREDVEAVVASFTPGL